MHIPATYRQERNACQVCQTLFTETHTKKSCTCQLGFKTTMQMQTSMTAGQQPIRMYKPQQFGNTILHTKPTTVNRQDSIHANVIQHFLPFRRLSVSAFGPEPVLFKTLMPRWCPGRRKPCGGRSVCWMVEASNLGLLRR